jgi:hypothetical protein
MPELCKRFVRNMLEIYSAFETQVMLATCQNSEMNYVRNLLEICPNCSRSLPELCFNYFFWKSGNPEIRKAIEKREMAYVKMQHSFERPLKIRKIRKSENKFRKSRNLEIRKSGNPEIWKSGNPYKFGTRRNPL